MLILLSDKPAPGIWNQYIRRDFHVVVKASILWDSKKCKSIGNNNNQDYFVMRKVPVWVSNAIAYYCNMASKNFRFFLGLGQTFKNCE